MNAVLSSCGRGFPHSDYRVSASAFSLKAVGGFWFVFLERVGERVAELSGMSIPTLTCLFTAPAILIWHQPCPSHTCGPCCLRWCIGVQTSRPERMSDKRSFPKSCAGVWVLPESPGS